MPTLTIRRDVRAAKSQASNTEGGEWYPEIPRARPGRQDQQRLQQHARKMHKAWGHEGVPSFDIRAPSVMTMKTRPISAAADLPAMV